MKSCKELIEKIAGGERGVQDAFEQLLNDPDCRKMAMYWYMRYPLIKSVIDWDDVLTESIIRFIKGVQSGKRIENCNPYFFGICKNVVAETARIKNEGAIPEDAPTDRLFEALRPYLDRLSAQCRILLRSLYFNPEPVNPKAREKLVEMLAEHGYQVQTGSISTLITRCKNNLKDSVKEDIENFEGFDAF